MAEPHDEELVARETSGTQANSEPTLRLRPEAVDWRMVEGQVVALDRARSVYLAINRSGAALWPAIVEGANRNQLVGILLETFDVESARATADVDAFVADLNDRGLLES